MILSSKSWPGSNIKFINFVLSSSTSKRDIVLISKESASALTGLFFMSWAVKIILTLLGKSAPLHLLGL